MPEQTFILNGKKGTVDVEDDVRVLWVLRDILGVTGPKYGCGINVCKACTSHINGRAFNPCAVRVGDLEPTDHITTIEGLGEDEVGQAVQAAWEALNVVQCGYCQPGQMMSAAALLRANPRPSDEDIDNAMSGNVCRCATYVRIRAAIHDAARSLAGRSLT